jgi:hypothetical protein
MISFDFWVVGPRDVRLKTHGSLSLGAVDLTDGSRQWTRRLRSARILAGESRYVCWSDSRMSYTYLNSEGHASIAGIGERQQALAKRDFSMPSDHAEKGL